MHGDWDVCLFVTFVYFLLSAILGQVGYKREESCVTSPHLFIHLTAVTMSKDGANNNPEKVNWPARDVRGTGAKPKLKRGMDVCSLCAGICCGTARELIAEAFGMGQIQVSPKVSRGGIQLFPFLC